MERIIKSDSTVLVTELGEYVEEYRGMSARLMGDGDVSLNVSRFYLDRQTHNTAEGYDVLREHGTVYVSREHAKAFAELILEVLAK